MPELSNIARLNHLQATLRARFPVVFPEDPRALRPLKIGIHEELLAALGEEAEARILQRLLARHTNRTAYLYALRYASHRIDLRGRPVQRIGKRHRAQAAQKLEAIRARWQARAAANATSPPTEASPNTPAPPPPADSQTPPESPRLARETLRLPKHARGRASAPPGAVRTQRRQRPGP